jgi:small GTP-binding protein
VFKLCIFGDGGVGKSTLIHRYLTKVFDEDLKMTIGADFSVKDMEIAGKNVRLRIWDFAGEERYQVLMPSYVKGAHGGIYMFDTTRYASLRRINNWLSFFKEEEKRVGMKLPIIMMGGKIDLEDKRSVTQDEALELAEKYKLQGYMETSAKTGQNVEEIFETITMGMMKIAKLI